MIQQNRLEMTELEDQVKGVEQNSRESGVGFFTRDIYGPPLFTIFSCNLS